MSAYTKNLFAPSLSDLTIVQVREIVMLMDRKGA